MNTRSTRIRFGALLVATALSLTGCAAAGTATPDAPTTAAAASSVTIHDAWVKAAGSGMSAAFGVLTNDGDRDVTVVSATTPASTRLELHETVADANGQMVMRQIEGGFVVPAKGSLTLQPGGDHIMLMSLTAPLTAGEDASFTLTFADDSTYEFSAPVKDYSGANEKYAGGDMHGDMGH